MKKKDAIKKLTKIIRANTIPENSGQFEENTVFVIDSISELRSDLMNLIDEIFKAGDINPFEVFDGTNRNSGCAYHISEPIAVAKEWGYKYILFNDRVIDIVNKVDTQILRKDLLNQ